MAQYKASDVALWFLFRNRLAESEGADRMTLMKLLKLLYYAEGCSLAIGNGSLFSEEIVAWEHGPVVEEVWRMFDDPYNLEVTDEMRKEWTPIEEKDSALLDSVFKIFGEYSAWGLRNMTHRETPWLEATDNGKRLNGLINRETMREYFKENYIE